MQVKQINKAAFIVQTGWEWFGPGFSLAVTQGNVFTGNNFHESLITFGGSFLPIQLNCACVYVKNHISMV